MLHALSIHVTPIDPDSGYHLGVMDVQRRTACMHTGVDAALKIDAQFRVLHHDMREPSVVGKTFHQTFHVEVGAGIEYARADSPLHSMFNGTTYGLVYLVFVRATHSNCTHEQLDLLGVI